MQKRFNWDKKFCHHQSVTHFVVNVYNSCSGGKTQLLITTNNPREQAWIFCQTHTGTGLPLYSCLQTLPGCQLNLCRSGCSPRSELSSGRKDREINQSHTQKQKIALHFTGLQCLSSYIFDISLKLPWNSLNIYPEFHVKWLSVWFLILSS